MTTTSISYNYEPVLSKRQILKRIYDAGHITFDELWVLINGDEPSLTINPYSYGIDPYPFEITTSDNNNERVHNGQ